MDMKSALPASELSSTARRLQARLRGLVGKAIEDYGMIAAGDRGGARAWRQPGSPCPVP